MKVTAIIQARMGSTRLPGKVLHDICGETMLSHVVNRVKCAKKIGQIIIATTTNPADEAIQIEANRIGVFSFRGNETDVLDRFYQACMFSISEAVVRITSDCPLIDPSVIDTVIENYQQKKPDYASNTLQRTYPRGLDTEIFSSSALSIAWQNAHEPYERSHVTPYFYQNPQKFNLLSVTSPIDYSKYRWTVDTAVDLEFVKKIYEVFGADFFSWQDVIRLLDAQPLLATMNQFVQQKPLESG